MPYLRRWLTRRCPKLALKLGLWSPSQAWISSFERANFAATFKAEMDAGHRAATEAAEAMLRDIDRA